MKTWLKVTASLSQTPDDWSAWAELFSRFGLPGTVQTDEPPTMSAFLPPGEEGSLPALTVLLEQSGACVETEQIEEIDWSEAWKQFFKPTQIGRSLWVRPSWEAAPVPEGRIEIVLDPGQAFGTGDHPTTRLCLELLEETIQSGDSVADVGCGSGILSVAAAKLGASSVAAVDVDPVSVQSTRENAKVNGVEVAAETGSGFEPLGTKTFDLALSNIISAALVQIAPVAAERIRPGGSWIVSGIIEPNWGDVHERCLTCGFEVVERRQEGDWIAAVLRR